MRESPGIEVETKTRLSQAYFNPLLLAFYDFALFRFISPLLWGCPVEQLLARYRRYTGIKHLEVGVGTGYLLDRFDAQNIDLTLMDLSKACLRKSCRRLLRFNPRLVHQNILEKITPMESGFDSISLNYVLHCVAGRFGSKAIVFQNLKPLLQPDGLIFGVTVLKTESSNFGARFLMGLLNRLGVFNNSLDEVAELEAALRRNFDYVTLHRASSAAMFAATDSEQSFRRVMAAREVQ